MAILGQILGTSYGRAPAQMSPIHMPGINIPGMAPDPNASAYRAPEQGQQPTQGQQQGQSIDDVINGFKARLQAMRGGQQGGVDFNNVPMPSGAAGIGGAQSIGPEPAPVPVPAAGGLPAAAGGGAGGGVMNSIMGAFNAGAGGGMDLTKLASLLPMLGL